MDLVFSKFKASKVQINKDYQETVLNDELVIDSKNDSNNIYDFSENDKNIDTINIIKNDDSKNTDLCQKSLTVDGIPTIEQQLKDIKEDEEKRKKDIDEQKIKRRNIVNMIKVISLHKMDKNPLINTSDLSHKEKVELIRIMNTYGDKVEMDIQEEFNKVCNETIFSPRADYSTYPVYDC